MLLELVKSLFPVKGVVVKHSIVIAYTVWAGVTDELPSIQQVVYTSYTIYCSDSLCATDPRIVFYVIVGEHISYGCMPCKITI